MQTQREKIVAKPAVDGQAELHKELNLDHNQDFPFKRNPKLGFEYFLEYAAWTEDSQEWLQECCCSPDLHFSIGEGSGQHKTPFSVSSECFTSVCTRYGFSKSFLRKIVAKAPMFEYRFSYDSTGPSHLEIAISTFENDSFFCLLRYDMKERSSRLLMFLKRMDHLRTTPRRPLLTDDLVAWLRSNQAIIQQNPLLLLNTILQFIQHEAHQYVQWRTKLYDLESRLGVTRDGKSLRSGDYPDIDHDFALLNADLAGLAKKFADSELSASTILEHGKTLYRLVEVCEQLRESNKDRKPQPAIPSIFEQKEEIQATIMRAELYLHNMNMAGAVLQSLSAVLYNRISKQDTDSMKTIAVVTLVFLPATFVSAIFSTGIFNFHAGESPEHPRTVSKYGWVYLLICVLSTTLTLVSWVCWYRWGRVWLDKLKFSRIHSEGKKPSNNNNAEQESDYSLDPSLQGEIDSHNSQVLPERTPGYGVANLPGARARFDLSTGWNMWRKVLKLRSSHGSFVEEAERGEAGRHPRDMHNPKQHTSSDAAHSPAFPQITETNTELPVTRRNCKLHDTPPLERTVTGPRRVDRTIPDTTGHNIEVTLPAPRPTDHAIASANRDLEDTNVDKNEFSIHERAGTEHEATGIRVLPRTNAPQVRQRSRDTENPEEFYGSMMFNGPARGIRW